MLTTRMVPMPRLIQTLWGTISRPTKANTTVSLLNNMATSGSGAGGGDGVYDVEPLGPLFPVAREREQ